GRVRLATDLTIQTAPVPHDEFGLGGIAAAVSTSLNGGSPPSFELFLRGLHLPGADAASDLHIGGPGVPLEHMLLPLVLGLLRQGVDGLAGPAAADVHAVLNLVGLGTNPAIPPLPVDQVIAQGPPALQAWISDPVGTPAAR